MHCLLDKVTARFAMQGLVKLGSSQNLTINEILTVSFISNAVPPDHRLFIAPTTANVLARLTGVLEYAGTIQFF